MSVISQGAGGKQRFVKRKVDYVDLQATDSIIEHDISKSRVSGWAYLMNWSVREMWGG